MIFLGVFFKKFLLKLNFTSEIFNNLAEDPSKIHSIRSEDSFHYAMYLCLVHNNFQIADCTLTILGTHVHPNQD